MKTPSRKRIIEWVLDAWSQLSKENIKKLFWCCDLNLRNDGTEDDFIHCLKKGQSWEAGRLKAELSTINFSWWKWYRKFIHFSLWWRGCQWRNRCDRGWNRLRDYNVDLLFFQLLVLCQRKKLCQQYFEFVNKHPARLNTPLKS